ncbi:MAG: hypothetical protein M3Z05_07600 [Gemmatimonadota bacterium]|nr:hypothetical protein [Gemmatimonadota bacterium]
MQRYPRLSVATVLVALFVLGCSDSKMSPPTGPSVAGAARSSTPGTCTTLANLTALANTVFGNGSPNVHSVLGKLNNLDKQLKKGHIVEAQDQARNIVEFVQAAATAGRLHATPPHVQAFISGVLCYAGLLSDTFLIYPSDQPQVIIDATGQGGISFPANPVSVPTLITLQLLDPGTSPLVTKLDKYPAYLEITSTSTLTQPAVVAVCPSISVPTDVVGRLRLGHQTSTGFEITPAADGGFLNCSGIAASRKPGWLRQLAQFVLPQPLYAATTFAGGGVGGLASEFSPFGPVDPQLSATSTIDASCSSATAIPGTALGSACRPAATVATRNGTLMQNVPIGWAVTNGGGAIAPNFLLTGTCGTFSTTAATTTDASGMAGVCWTLGPVAGPNTVDATPSAGGDAPAGVSFAPSVLTYTATGTYHGHTVTTPAP